ncbi:hypothetical protein L3X38_036957 [Prunus dulcis]|uniref:DUF4371 domain-containing protein n=1 Tax=Prunus dulcis TaxID=3755 RepID=A0AAD4V277_PRUDU|nr:hypothetical protein L3X38_036957 [Prunus dulcis]
MPATMLVMVSGGSTLGQEGSDDPLEGWKFGKGVHESPLGQLLEAPLYAHNVLDEMPKRNVLRSCAAHAAFCLHCYLFKSNFDQVGGDAFTGVGFNNWKKAKERFNLHIGPVGSVHNQAREVAYNLMHQTTHIETIVIKQTSQARTAYRTCLNASLKCTRYLLRQGLSFRGHDESTQSSNKGLVRAFEDDCLITGRGLNQERTFKRAGDTRCDPNDSSGEAYKLWREIQSFEFVFHLFVMKAILGITKTLSLALQKKDQDIVSAMNLVKTCKENLQLMRDNEFEELVEQASSFCYKNDIIVPTMDEEYVIPGRSRRNAPMKTNYHRYRVEIFIHVIDGQLAELNDRFNESHSAVWCECANKDVGTLRGSDHAIASDLTIRFGPNLKGMVIKTIPPVRNIDNGPRNFCKSRTGTFEAGAQGYD